MISIFVSVIALAVSIISIWRNERRYRSQNLKERMQDFQIKLAQYRSAIARLLDDEAVGNLYVIEAGNLAALRILKISGSKDGKQLKDFFSKPDSVPVIMASLVYGATNSNLRKSILSPLDTVSQHSGRHSEDFPLTNRLQEETAKFARGFFDPSRAAKNVADGRGDNMQKAISDTSTGHVLLSEASSLITDLIDIDIDKGTENFSIYKKLIHFLASYYLGQTDEYLEELSKHEKKIWEKEKHKHADSSTKPHAEEIIALTNLMRDFLKEEWSKIEAMKEQITVEPHQETKTNY